jgi:hypothetical protein
MSYDEMMKSHALERMKDGLRKLLALHSGVEVSSICGCLKLKVQQKASTSIEQIISYASETEEMVESKTHQILNFMWEGALWEYLHSIGHPVHPITIDPKITIIQIWNKGGVIGGDSYFTPHFISREVKKRFDEVKAEDIKKRLHKLREIQEAAKSAERKVISDNDYTSILTYFGQMSELRKCETSVREYLISELETARARVDSMESMNRLNRADLEAAELQLIKVAETLNQELLSAEFIAEQKTVDRMRIEMDLQRLANVMESYIESEKRNVTSGAEQIESFKFKEINRSPSSIRKLLKLMQEYRDMRDTADAALRERCRNHIDEIDALQISVRELEGEVEETYELYMKEKERAEKAERELGSTKRALEKAVTKHKFNSDESWGSTMRFASRASILEYKLKAIKPVLIAGMRNSNKAISTLCGALMGALDFVSDEEKKQIEDLVAMGKADKLSWDIQQKEAAAKLAKETSGKTGKKPNQKGGGSSPKKGKIGMQKKQSAASGTDDEKSIVTKSTASPSKSKSSKSKK